LTFKRVLIVFDSLRYDVYLEADTRLFDENIGKPQKAFTNSNFTPSSFLCFVQYNRLPYPHPFKVKYNYLRNLKEQGINVHLFTGMSFLDKTDVYLRTKYHEYFKTWKCYEKHNCAKDILRDLQKVSVDDSYLILWFGETHHPYDFGNSKTVYLKTRIAEFNAGKDSLDEVYLETLKRRQGLALEWLVKEIWNRFLKDYDGQVIITSDHGESFGENHKFGHGNDIHPCQFTVPLVFNSKQR